MIHQTLDTSKHDEVVALFTAVFTAAEGKQEGELIAKLTSQLASGIDDRDIICLGAVEQATLLGAIFFTKLQFSQPIQVFMLAPVAISTEHKGKGFGQALINAGLSELKQRSAKIAVTYGDPSFYSKVGFKPLSEEIIQAPLKLSMPFGWLGQSLTAEPIPTINARPSCVEAFNDPVYW